MRRSLTGGGKVRSRPCGADTFIECWSGDYGFQRSNAVSSCLHPRGLSAVTEGLAASPELRYAITGSLAAQPFAPCAPPRLAMIYVDAPEQLAERLGFGSLTRAPILCSRPLIMTLSSSVSSSTTPDSWRTLKPPPGIPRRVW